MEAGVALPREWLLQALDVEQISDPEEQVVAAVRAFRDAAQTTGSAGTTETVPARLNAFALRLQRLNPASLVLRRRLQSCAEAAGEGVERAREAAERELGELERLPVRFSRVAERLFRPGVRVFTPGFSSTVVDLLSRVADRLESVTVTEGRPRGSGVRLGAALGALAIPVRLITEAELELLLPESDAAFAMADRVLPGGEVVARIGTAVAARLCHAHRIPFYVLADRARWAPAGDELARFFRERRSPSKILKEVPPGVQVVNLASDLTPAELVTSYITEDEIICPSSLARAA